MDTLSENIKVNQSNERYLQKKRFFIMRLGLNGCCWVLTPWKHIPTLRGWQERVPIFSVLNFMARIEKHDPCLRISFSSKWDLCLGISFANKVTLCKAAHTIMPRKSRELGNPVPGECYHLEGNGCLWNKEIHEKYWDSLHYWGKFCNNGGTFWFCSWESLHFFQPWDFY